MITDYSKKDSWLNLPSDRNKPVDVFYLYPTTWSRKSEDEPLYSEISNKQMRKNAEKIYESHSLVFKEDCNIYAPFYRQMDATYGLTRPKEIVDKLVDEITYADVLASFEYFIEHFNNGRPYILAGHSQGSALLRLLLARYMKENPKVYKRMIVAYVVGSSITSEYLKENKHLKFAKNAFDTGVIVSYNTEAEFSPKESLIIRKNTIAINPINWRRDDVRASYRENLGELIMNENGHYTVKKPGTKDASIDEERGTVICHTADAQKYKHKWFPLGVYHTHDYEFYFGNLKQNVKDRIDSYLK
ncbi:MAG: DUF3089 domain-containing protein [Anaerovoracaceae bacterium]